MSLLSKRILVRNICDQYDYILELAPNNIVVRSLKTCGTEVVYKFDRSKMRHKIIEAFEPVSVFGLSIKQPYYLLEITDLRELYRFRLKNTADYKPLSKYLNR